MRCIISDRTLLLAASWSWLAMFPAAGCSTGTADQTPFDNDAAVAEPPGSGGFGRGRNPPGGGGLTDAAMGEDAPPVAPVTPDAMPPVCTMLKMEHPDQASPHVGDCSTPKWNSNPPNSGEHFGTWASYTTYEAPVPWGFLVHNLEHGAIVFSYNCPQGCPQQLADMKAMIAQLRDSTCEGSNEKVRAILVPDPALDVRFAAAAWRWTLKSNCFVPEMFSSFFNERLGKSPEPNVCNDGVNLSKGGWCP